MHPRARELLHAQDLARADSLRPMAVQTIERRIFELLLGVDAVRAPVALDLLAEQAREIAAGWLVATRPLEGDEVECELAGSGVAARDFDELLAAYEAHGDELFGRREVVAHAREHDDARVQRGNALGDERGGVARQGERAVLIESEQLQEAREIGDIRAKATTEPFEEGVASSGGTELGVTRLARAELRELPIGRDDRWQFGPARRRFHSRAIGRRRRAVRRAVHRRSRSVGLSVLGRGLAAEKSEATRDEGDGLHELPRGHSLAVARRRRTQRTTSPRKASEP